MPRVIEEYIKIDKKPYLWEKILPEDEMKSLIEKLLSE